MIHEILFPMDLTWKMVLLVPIGVFLASVVDGIAGGGGMISLPTYFLAGLPAHLALGTNKLSSCIGTSVSAARFIRGGFVDWKLAWWRWLSCDSTASPRSGGTSHRESRWQSYCLHP